MYPNLRQKFGKEVTFWDDPKSHGRTEFAFDVLQVARGRYAPDRYRAFVGFQVAKPVLERAFLDTYGFELKSVFANLDLAIGTYRYTVGSILPGMTRVAWRLKSDEVTREIPGATKEKFLYNLSRSSYEKEWGTEYHKAGIRTRLATWMIRIFPKSGPLGSLKFRTPTPEVEKMYMASFNATVDSYRALLANVSAGNLKLTNENFDIGEPTAAGKYVGADKAYDHLLARIADRKFEGVSAKLRSDILDYYKDRKPPPVTKQSAAEWTKLRERVELLGQFQTAVATGP